MTDKKKQPEKNTGTNNEKNQEKPENTGDLHNAGKQVNQQRSQGEEDLDVKNEVTGANLDGQPI